MTSQQIEYVLTLAQQGSFSKAARRLSVSQPSLSQYIINIENQLGTPLFNRSATPIKLTPAGEAYVRAAVQIKSIEENLRNEISDIEDLKAGSLRLGTTIFRACSMLPRSIAEFCRVYSGVKVSVTEDASEHLIEKILNGEIDILIGTGDYDPKLFDSEPLADERLLLAVPTDSPINESLAESRLTAEDICSKSMQYLTAKPVDLSVLSDENVIVCDDGMEFTAEKIYDIFAGSGVTPKYSLQVRSVESAFSFVKAGLGVSFLPDSLIRFGDFRSHPYYYPLTDKVAKNVISLVYRKNGFLSKAAREYGLILKQLISNGTWRTM